MAGGGRAWRFLITRSAEKQIADLPSRIGDQVDRTIQRLIDTLSKGGRPQDMRKLVGREFDYRIDSGEYRILFSMVEQNQGDTIVSIWRVGHRRDVYRGV